ncbi:hypothetical protein [Brachybacterium sp. GCM10030252]|uniref:hypothetical protein n=1 Tax=Brachybacterium sp. GCM10030252 TaxID=3273380 RepID=UPI00361F3FF9
MRIYNDPDLWKMVKDQFARLVHHGGNSVDDMLSTIETLREQVSYLVESADDEDELRRAKAWGKQLDKCDHAARLLKTPGSSKSERSALKTRVEALRSDILNAFIIEQEEDARARDALES